MGSAPSKKITKICNKIDLRDIKNMPLDKTFPICYDYGRKKGELPMRKHSVCTALMICLCLCTACSVPEPEPWEDLETVPTAEPSVTETFEETTEKIVPTTVPVSEPESTDITDETGETDESGAAETTDTEETTEEIKYPWQDAYALVLSAKTKASEYEKAYFALVSINSDNIPELVVLIDTTMELYCFDGTKASLLLEDGYKGNAVDGQNVCYQPGTGLFSTAFSTMGGGSGFTIFEYMQMDTMNVNRYYFDNSENIDGELPYNSIWNRAEEFEVTDNGYRDVTLGDSWVHIGEGFERLTELSKESAAQVGEGWQSEIEIPEDETEEPT